MLAPALARGISGGWQLAACAHDVGQELAQEEPTWRRSEEETVVAERDDILADPGTERLVLSVAMEMHRDQAMPVGCGQDRAGAERPAFDLQNGFSDL